MENKTKRYLYLGFGWLMFTIGFIGAFLPVLPTTPFMILALWGFSRGSEALHDWLYNHPKFGETLRDWDKYRIIPMKAKLMAISMMTLSASYLIFFSNIPDLGLILALGLMLYGTVFILSKPSRPTLKKNIDIDTRKDENFEASSNIDADKEDQPPL